jgi:hypothetical protein
MRTLLLVAATAFTVVMTVTPTAVAQAPARDSLAVTGTARDTTGLLGFSFGDIDIHASSGPSGESPSGRGFLVVTNPGPGNIAIGSRSVDNVTCLAVSGNHAVVVFRDATFGLFVAEAMDNGPANSGLDTFFALPGDPSRSPSDCSPLGLMHSDTVTSGDVAIQDAPPLPTSKDQCKNGSWRNFPGFKNQGDCVSFVTTGGKQP